MASDAAAAPPAPLTSEEIIAKHVFDSIQEQLTVQLREEFDKSQAALDTAVSRIDVLERDLRDVVISKARPPKVNPPATYDGKSKDLAERFFKQVSSTAEFEMFRDDVQKNPLGRVIPRWPST
jgi:hypothetical protein